MDTQTLLQGSPERGAAATLLACALPILVAAGMAPLAGMAGLAMAIAAAIWAGIAALVLRELPRHHPHPRYGPANVMTTMRAAIAAVVATFALVAMLGRGVPCAGAACATASWQLALTAGGVAALILDGLDGAAARRSGLASRFGARFDMETDAFLGLALALWLWQGQSVGVWVLGLGLPRYLFVLASLALPALNAPLFPSWRRKALCVVQIAALCLLTLPGLPPGWIGPIGGATLACLAFSFARDTIWLLRRAG